jgi:hypothetical protein
MEYYCVVYTDGHEHSQVTFVKASSVMDAQRQVERLDHCLWVDQVYKRVWVKE